MSIALVQTVKVVNGAANPVVVSIASTGAGNFIIVLLESTPQTNTITGITDDAGNNYIQVPGAQATQNLGITELTDIWYAFNSNSGATSVTINYATGNGRMVIIEEWSGIKQTSPLDTSGHLNNQVVAPGNGVGPSLTTSENEELLLAVASNINDGGAITSVDAPWTIVKSTPSADNETAYLVTSSSGMYKAVFEPSQNLVFCSSGAAFFAKPDLTLTLSDSVSSSDSTAKEDDKTVSDSITSTDLLGLARAQNVSDSTTVKDSFSLQSSFIAPNPIPSVETLTNNLIPAEVKTFWKFQ